MTPKTEVFNMRTGQTLTFNLPVKEALRAAYEQAKPNINWWGYKPLDAYNFTYGAYTTALGDFAVLKK